MMVPWWRPVSAQWQSPLCDFFIESLFAWVSGSCQRHTGSNLRLAISNVADSGASQSTTCSDLEQLLRSNRTELLNMPLSLTTFRLVFPSRTFSVCLVCLLSCPLAGSRASPHSRPISRWAVLIVIFIKARSLTECRHHGTRKDAPMAALIAR